MYLNNIKLALKVRFILTGYKSFENIHQEIVSFISSQNSSNKIIAFFDLQNLIQMWGSVFKKNLKEETL